MIGWLAAGAAAWLAAATGVAISIGRAIRTADTAQAIDHDDDAPPLARLMLRRDELRFYKSAHDLNGCVTLGLLDCSPGALGVLMDDNGEAIGLRLERDEVQALREAITVWLCDTAAVTA